MTEHRGTKQDLAAQLRMETGDIWTVEFLGLEVVNADTTVEHLRYRRNDEPWDERNVNLVHPCPWLIVQWLASSYRAVFPVVEKRKQGLDPEQDAIDAALARGDIEPMLRLSFAKYCRYLNSRSDNIWEIDIDWIDLPDGRRDFSLRYRRDNEPWVSLTDDARREQRNLVANYNVALRQINE